MRISKTNIKFILMFILMFMFITGIFFVKREGLVINIAQKTKLIEQRQLLIKETTPYWGRITKFIDKEKMMGYITAEDISEKVFFNTNKYIDNELGDRVNFYVNYNAEKPYITVNTNNINLKISQLKNVNNQILMINVVSTKKVPKQASGTENTINTGDSKGK